MAELRNYVEWHRIYDDPDSSMSWRLGVVRSLVSQFLDEHPGAVRILSSCAGDGRDVLDVLAHRDDASRVSVVLLEIDPVLAARAREAGRLTGADVEVREVDAGSTDAYQGAVPADLVLLVGIFGNLATADVERAIAAAPHLCAADGLLVWSHGRVPHDRNSQVRRWLTAAGFDEEFYAELDRRSHPSVGMWRLTGRPAPLEPGRRLFEFVQ
ncbi:MAG: class I SAM-dependent methyltransferase [Nocardioides sp.]|uniref:SAM-dependent methyltransferase n=1 Tax=Nocardioides sp. TaxID=35761 RepID=UPI0039E3A4BB